LGLIKGGKVNFSNFRNQFVLIGLTSAIFGCQQIKQTVQSWKIGDKDIAKLISTMPTNQKNGFFIIQLQTPALLKGVISQDGVLQIDEERKKSILKEQADLEVKLSELSKEIKIIYKYQLSLNAFYIFAPISVSEELGKIASVVKVERASAVARPLVEPGTNDISTGTFQGSTSVDFIGSKIAHELGYTGKGIKVGVIDTGIDYTHAMLGGPGTAEAYKATNPSEKTNLFPNKKVVGGIDLVGTKFNAASPKIEDSIPTPDDNPLDEGGHGSHVAGTIAGFGDGQNSYSGVAPEADLYGIKVFGADGSTSDAVVIAAFEYALDPDHNLDPSDRLDVVNLSLGSSYGTPKILYNEAVQTASDTGLVVVASAGNSGHSDYIVGAPSTTDASISVAASIDNMNHNFIFDALKVSIEGQPDRAVDFVEATISKPISEIQELAGKLVPLGLAGDLSEEQKAQVKGRIALIDRGQFTFSVKIKNAFEAGALGVVVINNQDGPAFVMGGDGKFDIPAIMISKSEGQNLKAFIGKEIDVFVNFKSDVKISKPELIDTLTDFSSKGPRSIDSAIKPEISAPGAAIVSAEMGGGAKTVKMSGTSMAAPHMSGVMALLKQKFPTLSSNELKSVAMGSAKVITDAEKKIYPVSLQGSGRVQLDKSIQAQVVVDTPALSLGEVNVGKAIIIRKKIIVKNISQENLNLKIISDLNPAFSLSEQLVSISAGQSNEINLDFKIQGNKFEKNASELDGRVLFIKGDLPIHQIPVLAIGLKTSEIKANSLEIAADSEQVSKGALTSLTLENTSTINSGVALPFNLLANSDRKLSGNVQDQNKAMSCDLESVGYRIIDTEIDGIKNKILQIALKTYSPLTTWHFCESNVQIDADNDGVADQELAGVYSDNIPGLGAQKFFASALFDANKLRDLRKKYENDLASPVSDIHDKASENYETALVDRLPLLNFDHSTVNILQVNLGLLKMNLSQSLKIKVGMQTYESDPMSSFDIINKWYSIDPNQGQPFVNLPESIKLKAGETAKVQFEKGSAQGSLILYFPQNAGLNATVGNDIQSAILSPSYGVK
jgi:subtilisin family serine protease